MTSENLGETEDLALNDEDADKVVGGVKKKKATAKKKTVPAGVGGVRHDVPVTGGTPTGGPDSSDYLEGTQG